VGTYQYERAAPYVVRRRKSVKQCMLIYIMQMELKSIKKQRLVFES
jgi:hypothetical protein